MVSEFFEDPDDSGENTVEKRESKVCIGISNIDPSPDKLRDAETPQLNEKQSE